MVGELEAKNGCEVKPEMVAGDPVLRWLSEFRVSPVLVGLVYAVGWGLIKFLSVQPGGNLWTLQASSGARTVGFLGDPGTFANLVGHGIIVAFYVWMPRGIASVFNGIDSADVIRGPKERTLKKPGAAHNYYRFLKQMERSFGRPWRPALLLGLVILVAVRLVIPSYQSMQGTAWWNADTLNLVESVMFSAIGHYCVGYILFYTALTTHWLGKLFRGFDVRLHPLYPDGAGGWEHWATLRLS